MDRRRFLIAGVSAAAAATSAATPAHAAVQWPLFEWEQPGGFFFPGEAVLQPPPLAVYDDCVAFADAGYRQRLPQPDVDSLQAYALQVLNDPANTRRDPDKPVRDRPVDQVRVRQPGGGYRTVHLDGWLNGDPDSAYPAALHSLNDRVQNLRHRITAAGERWQPDAVLLAAARMDYEPDSVHPWPRPVPIPPGRLYGELRLRGADASTLRRAMPMATEHVWPMYRAADGTILAATWRYLLPHE